MGDVDQRPSISFLSTAYRTEHCVAKMIESVLAQTRSDWELVVVDNGNSDEMARIVSEYVRTDPRIRLVRQENRGAAGGVNAAARHARGRYFITLNSDDQVLPEYAEKLAGRLDASPALDAVAPDAFMVLRPSEVLLTDTFSRNKARQRDPRPLSIHDLFCGFSPYYGAAIRREAWETVGGLRDEHGFPDLQLWFDLTVSGKRIALVDEPLGVYTIDDASESKHISTVENLEWGREEMILEAARRSGLPQSDRSLTRAVRQARHRRAVVRARARLLEGDTAAARAAVRDALREAWDTRTAAIATVIVVAPVPLRRAYQLRERLRPGLRRLQLRASRLLPHTAHKLSAVDLSGAVPASRKASQSVPIRDAAR